MQSYCSVSSSLENWWSERASRGVINHGVDLSQPLPVQTLGQQDEGTGRRAGKRIWIPISLSTYSSSSSTLFLRPCVLRAVRKGDLLRRTGAPDQKLFIVRDPA